MAKIILPLSPIPPVPFIVALTGNNEVVFDSAEHFEKQTIRSRYHILSANGVLTLSLNVVGQKGGKIPTSQIELDYRKDWVRDHLRAIESAYRSAPFFEHYFPEVESILSKRYATLGDFFYTAFPKWLKLMGLEEAYNVSEEYIEIAKGVDLRKRIKTPEQYPASLLSGDYLQVFADRFTFQRNLSVIDLLMNEGPAAGTVLKV